MENTRSAAAEEGWQIMTIVAPVRQRPTPATPALSQTTTPNDPRCHPRPRQWQARGRPEARPPERKERDELELSLHLGNVSTKGIDARGVEQAKGLVDGQVDVHAGDDGVLEVHERALHLGHLLQYQRILAQDLGGGKQVGEFLLHDGPGDGARVGRTGTALPHDSHVLLQLHDDVVHAKYEHRVTSPSRV